MRFLHPSSASLPRASRKRSAVQTQLGSNVYRRPHTHSDSNRSGASAIPRLLTPRSTTCTLGCSTPPKHDSSSISESFSVNRFVSSSALGEVDLAPTDLPSPECSTEFPVSRPVSRPHVHAALIEPVDHDHSVPNCRRLADANEHALCCYRMSFTVFLVHGYYVPLYIIIAQDLCEKVTAMVYACKGVHFEMCQCQSFLRPHVSGLCVFHLASRSSS